MSVSHNLPKEEALKRIKTLLGEVKTQFAENIYNLNERWDGDTGTFSFSAMGFSVSGTLTVKPDSVELAGNLPLAAGFFKGKIEKVVKERAKTLLA